MVLSHSFRVNVSVHQGTVLTLTLFLLCIADFRPLHPIQFTPLPAIPFSIIPFLIALSARQTGTLRRAFSVSLSPDL